ncbi:MAG: beta-galactosidase [Anaerolineae bacterium]|nr:beta-galactosidase [Anaerolineae bacterium]MBT7989385.1 beta-galactosidase [Anaerolineae bacterium]
MKLGVCYYPEHWSENNWETDAKEMHTAGISIVRIAEFAWAKMEPEEGKYTWDWLDRSIETLASAGHQIVLCTPTAAPPAWMMTAHPDILPVDEEGRRRRFGSRRHYCPSDPTYHKYSERITHAMAERYGNHPAVIGWQIDNEFGCYFTRCYCETCTTEFRHWLQSKYSSLDELNERWGTIFWSQTYNKWTQIEPHNLTVAEPNPSHVLDYYRFASDSWTAYQQIQIDALRESIPTTQFITHNIIASLTTIDFHDLARDLDFVAWDSYPTGYAEMGSHDLYAPDEQVLTYAHDTGDPLLTGFFHSLTRGLKQAPYWIMEQQTGAINWSKHNTGVRPGALRLWTWQAAASGTEATVFFRWKASRFGLEQHHAGLRNHDGSADIGYADLLTIKSERDKLDDFIAQPLQTDIGILLDYSTLWAMEMQPHRKDFAYLKHLFVFYRACKALSLEPDIISSQADLSRYKILLAPNAFLADKVLAEKLDGFAAQGGTLMLGVRSGFKDINDVVTEEPLPGFFRELVGARVKQWHSLPPKVSYAFRSEVANFHPEATFWAEGLEADAETRSLANYTDFPFEGLAAITEKTHGKGKVFYCGIYPQLAQAVALMCHLAASQSIPLLDIPAGLTVIRRGNSLLAMNFTEEILVFEVASTSYDVPARDFILL